MAFGPEAGLRLLDGMPGKAVLRRYAPLPAARGDLLFRAGRRAEARPEFERAAALTRNIRERAFLLKRAAAFRTRKARRDGRAFFHPCGDRNDQAASASSSSSSFSGSSLAAPRFGPLASMASIFLIASESVSFSTAASSRAMRSSAASYS